MYTKQSLHVFDRDVKYQEGFQSASDVIKNGAVEIGAPTYSNGIITFGGSDAINIDHVLERLRSTTTGTWIARVRVTDAGVVQAFITFGDTSANSFIQLVVISNLLRCDLVNAGVTEWSLDTDVGVISSNTFVEIGMVHTGTNQILYVDGVAPAQTHTTTTDLTQFFNNIAALLDNGRIGARDVNAGGNSLFQTGDVDWVKIYDRELTADEMASHFGNRLYTPPPIANQVLNIDPRLGTLTDRWGNTVTNNSVTVVNDGGFTAGEYDGSSSFLNIDAVLSASLATTTAGTWIAWVKPFDATPSDFESFITFGDTNANEYLVLGIRGASSGILRFQCFDEGTDQWTLDVDTAPFTSNIWAHIAIVQDGTTPVLYVDGVAVAQTFTTSLDTTFWFNNLVGLDNARIGDSNFNSGGEDLHFDGRIGPVKVYDTNLSAALIERDYLTTKHYFGR